MRAFPAEPVQQPVVLLFAFLSVSQCMGQPSVVDIYSHSRRGRIRRSRIFVGASSDGFEEFILGRGPTEAPESPRKNYGEAPETDRAATGEPNKPTETRRGPEWLRRDPKRPQAREAPRNPSLR